MANSEFVETAPTTEKIVPKKPKVEEAKAEAPVPKQVDEPKKSTETVKKPQDPKPSEAAAKHVEPAPPKAIPARRQPKPGQAPAPVVEEVKEGPLVIQEADVFAGEKFDDLPVNDKLKQILRENNFDDMTKIQKSSVPIILKN